MKNKTFLERTNLKRVQLENYEKGTLTNDKSEKETSEKCQVSKGNSENGQS